MSRFIKSAAFAAAAMGALLATAPQAMAWGHGGGWGPHHPWGGWGFGRRILIAPPVCRWQSFVTFRGNVVVRRVCF